MYTRTTLPNGLRVLLGELPSARSVSVCLFIGIGSRYEPDELAGVSHFIEHMVFKGTGRWPEARLISEAIESTGGTLNAATDRELTVYWAKVPAQHFRVAAEVIIDLVRNPLFPPAELEKERQVILEELRMVNDTPQQLVDLLIDQVMWPNQPIGRDVAGTKESVSAMSLNQLVDFWARTYGPNNAVVAVAGRFNPEEVLDLLYTNLHDWEPADPPPFTPATEPDSGPRVGGVYRRTEQAHFCLAAPGLAITDPDRPTLDLLNVILGDGMSSRLFLELRERRGIVYDVHSYVEYLRDTGSETIYAGVEPARLPEALAAVVEQLGQLTVRVDEAELKRAQDLVKGRLELRLEDTRSYAGWLGTQELLTGKVMTVDEMMAEVDRVSPDDIVRLARRLFRRDRLNLAVVGPIRRPERLATLLSL
ncbi:MAG: insulinase family protein [Chloroflexota bacterium]